MEADHDHCMSCVNLRCMVRPQPGVSCDLTACPLVCGAVFHSCKVDEHHLLCPLVRVPCLNSGYGCPATLVRSQMCAHLKVCPAGVVCCTMEWNRWPISSLDYTSYESLSRGVEEAEQLDMALALQDQRTLLESLKVIAMAPIAEGEPPTFIESPSESSSCQPQPHSPKSAKEKIIGGINGLNEEHFSKLYEATVETARSLAAALEFVSNANLAEGGADCANKGPPVPTDRLSSIGDGGSGTHGKTPEAAEALSKSEKEKQSVCSGCLRGGAALPDADAQACPSEAMETGAGNACPVAAQEDANCGVSQESVTPQMAPPVPVSQGVAQRADHVVLEDRGLVLLENCRPERKYHKYQFFRGQVQCSLPNGRTAVIPDNSLYRLRPKMEDKAVDTSDLEQDEDHMGLEDIDLITAAQLFCLEESRECRRISDTVYVDGYHVDFGTQTFTFPAAILVTNTRVGDMASASACDHAAPQLPYPSPFRTLRLGVAMEALEMEAVPHNRYLPANPRYQHMFPFVCGQSFRRDQFASHFMNVHGEIHAGLNGWMEHRCPLAYYGCTFSQRRFYPSTQGAKVIHDRHLRSFGVQPCPRAKLPSDCQSDQLSGLPIEILLHIAGYLDSFSLCQLSLVSRTMREVCANLLKSRGIVHLQWERRHTGALGLSWEVKNRVWRFSTAFSPVLSWHFTDLPSMSDHLKKCHYNAVEQKTEPVPLPAMCTTRDGQSLRRVLRHVMHHINT